MVVTWSAVRHAGGSLPPVYSSAFGSKRQSRGSVRNRSVLAPPSRPTHKAGHVGPASPHYAYRQISISVAILLRTQVVNPALARFACQA